MYCTADTSTMTALPIYLRGKTILLDIDGTLTPAGSEYLAPDIVEAVGELLRHNKVYLFSNKGLPERNAKVAERLGIELISSVHSKPDPRVLRTLELEGELVVVGDKVLTDGLLAAFTRAKFIQVPRITAPDEPLPDRVFNFVDDLAALMGRHLYLMRPTQWAKNGLIFAPLFFAQQFFAPLALGSVTATFFAFSFLASATYILNDLFDREADREHPHKRNRPLASGKIRVSDALLSCALLIAVGAILLTTLAPSVLPVASLYLLSSAAYSLYGKHIPYVEMLFFVWFYYARMVAGGAAAGVELSVWLTLAVGLLALFLVSAKRYAERAAGRVRGVLTYYPLVLLRFILGASAVLVIISYTLWALYIVGSLAAVGSVVAVLVAIARYHYLATRGVAAEYPEKLVFEDRFLLAAFAVWFLLILAVSY